MSDNLGNRGNPGRSVISTSGDDEVASWTRRLDVTKEELQNAIDSAGIHSVAEAEKRLEGNKKSK